MLTYWLSPTTNTLPNYASHFVGCGGLVINDKKEVLAVKEKNGRLTGNAVYANLPHGRNLENPRWNVQSSIRFLVNTLMGIREKRLRIVLFEKSLRKRE